MENIFGEAAALTQADRWPAYRGLEAPESFPFLCEDFDPLKTNTIASTKSNELPKLLVGDNQNVRTIPPIARTVTTRQSHRSEKFPRPGVHAPKRGSKVISQRVPYSRATRKPQL